MSSFWTEVKRNPTGYRLLVGFVAIWGAGMLWGLLTVIGYLRKRGAALRVIRRLGFQRADNNPVLMETVKDCCLRSVYRNLGRWVEADPRPELVNVSTGPRFVRLSYDTTNEAADLPRPVGLKERIQVLNRTVTLSKLHYRSTGAGEEFYAEVIDSKRVRQFQPRTKVTSAKEWLFCVTADTPYPATMTIHRKFTGAAGLLTDMAFRIADVSPVLPGGLLPEFADVFTASVGEFAEELPQLDESVQRRVLAEAASFETDVKLVLDPTGVWLNGQTWPTATAFHRLLALCESLVNP